MSHAPAGTGYGGAIWWRIATIGSGPDGPAGIEVTLGGDLDENVTFVELAPLLRGRVIFDLAEVRRINSCGVREWVMFHRDLVPASVTAVEFRACSPAVVAQLNTIANFRGRARVRSFLAPYVCEQCEIEEQRLVEVAHDPGRTALPAFPCPRCDAKMTLDDLPDRYLSFLREE